MNSDKINFLLQTALNIKKRFLKMYADANAGHIGSALSCAEILTATKFLLMQENDKFILSKGHAAAALYSVLAESGELNEADINTFYKNGTYLAAHPPANKIKGISFATGSLGHGLSLAAGFAMASNFRNDNRHFYCITSDGELNEGSIWEAALFIAHHNLINVVWLIDRNNFQGFGATEDVMKLNPLDKKLESFGFSVLEIDGHNFNDFIELKEKIKTTKQPMAIICNTKKGRGWAAFEDTLDSHYLPFAKDECAETIKFLELEFHSIKSQP